MLTQWMNGNSWGSNGLGLSLTCYQMLFGYRHCINPNWNDFILSRCIERSDPTSGCRGIASDNINGNYSLILPSKEVLYETVYGMYVGKFALLHVLKKSFDHQMNSKFIVLLISMIQFSFSLIKDFPVQCLMQCLM